MSMPYDHPLNAPDDSVIGATIEDIEADVEELEQETDTEDDDDEDEEQKP